MVHTKQRVLVIAALMVALAALGFFALEKPTQALDAGTGAILDSTGCRTNSLAATDDGSTTSAVALPSTLRFFGTDYNSLYVNNNGNVTFDSPLSTYTPFNLSTTNRVIVAPFFADVDTRGAGSGVTTYGTTTYGGREAFCVNWVNVGYFNSKTDKTNSFQLLLVDRSDVGAGDFDIVFNYDKVQWETGDSSGGSGGLGGSSARVGYSNGSTTSFELPGSAVNGAFLDSNPSGLIHGSRDSLTNGRYVFPVRNGAAPGGGTISGHVYANSAGTGNELNGALVQVCGNSGHCNTTSTNTNGEYNVAGLASDSYNVQAFPPSGSELNPRGIGPLSISGTQTLSGQDIVLSGPTPPPAGTTITDRGTTASGVPIAYWGDPLQISTNDIGGGTGSFEIILDGDIIRSGTLSEGPSGTYSGTAAPLIPNHGNAQVRITIVHATSTTNITFDVYIDPSGNVRTVSGAPIQGATVTLLRSDSAAGPFEVVPNGSAVMSPSNRTNPDTTDSDGHFGWDVIAGFYKVRASKAGCVSPSDPSQDFAESAVMTIPPPVTDLDLRLDCDTQAPTVTKVIPQAGATRVSRRTNVAATFSEKMRGSTINQLTFRLNKKGSAKALGAKVTYNATSNTATLNPNKQLLGGATYKATVTTGAKDLAGNPLATNKVWSFKTRR